MEIQPNVLNHESRKVGLKIHRGKTKFMTNIEIKVSIQTDNIEI